MAPVWAVTGRKICLRGGGGWRGRKERRVNNKIYSKAQSGLRSQGCSRPAPLEQLSGWGERVEERGSSSGVCFSSL